MPDISDSSTPAKLATDLKSELDEVYAANERTAKAYDLAVQQRDEFAAQTDALSEKIDLLESEVDSASDVRTELQAKLALAESAKHEAEAQLELALQDLKHQNEKMSASLKAVTSREAELLDRAENLASELAKSQTSFQSANHEVSRLTDELLHRAEQLRVQESAQASLQDESSRLANTIDQLKTQLDDSIEHVKQTQIDHQRYQQHAAAIEAELRSSLEQATRSTDLMHNDLTALQKDRESLTEVLERERADRSLSDRSAAKMVQSLTNQLKAARDELAASKAASKQALAKSQALADQAGVSASELRQTEGLLSSFVRELENTGSQLKERTAELQQLRDAKRLSDQQMSDCIRDLEARLSAACQRVDESDDLLRHERSINIELTRRIADQTSGSNEESAQQASTSQLEYHSIVGVDQDKFTVNEEPEATVTQTDVTKSAAAPKTKRSTKRRKSARAANDLTLIEGIGPKIRDLLAEKRITTFRKLSTMNAAQLERILTKAGMSLKRHDPSNWPEQAKLAADGNFDRLKELKQNLAKNWVTNCVRPVH
jgi:predicted flap endonuclease-1-like 5' DNA nuclease